MTIVTPSRSGAHRRRLVGPVLLNSWLTARLHVDLLRLASAICRAR
ncbi:MAG: putative leader peptide [Pseudonocardiaceae bacterium]